MHGCYTRNYNNCMFTANLFFQLVSIQLDPTTVWIKQEMGRRCYFSDSSGHFNIDAEGLGASGFTFRLIVEGYPC